MQQDAIQSGGEFHLLILKSKILKCLLLDCSD